MRRRVVVCFHARLRARACARRSRMGVSVVRGTDRGNVVFVVWNGEWAVFARLLGTRNFAGGLGNSKGERAWLWRMFLCKFRNQMDVAGNRAKFLFKLYTKRKIAYSFFF